MKTILSVVMTCMLLGIANLSSARSVPVEVGPELTQLDEHRKLKIKVRIILKKASSGCTSGKGFCGIVIGIGNFEIQVEIDSANARLMQAGDGQLQFEFDKATMMEETAAKHFGSGTFTVEEPYAVGAEIEEELGLPTGTTIQPGTFAVEETEESYIVLVPILP